MATGSTTKTDLYSIFNIVQNTMLGYPRELVVEVLKDAFSKDSYYHYVYDKWGFAKTPNHKNLPLGAGIDDNSTTRIYIGTNYRMDQKYYPAIIVKSGSSRYVPISLSRNQEFVEYSTIKVMDGYGNEKNYSMPSKFVTSGAYEGSLTIDIIAGDIHTRDELVGLVSILINEVYFDYFVKSGVIIKPTDVGSPSEVDDANEKLFKQSITLNIRTEWRRAIPIENIVDVINFCVDFGNLSDKSSAIAPNISVNTNIDFIDEIYDLF